MSDERVLFWYLFPSLLRNSGNKHQNNPLVSAKTIRHSSTYIILYICYFLTPHNIYFTADTHQGIAKVKVNQYIWTGPECYLKDT